MLSHNCNSMDKAACMIFHRCMLLHPGRCIVAYHSTCNACIMDLPLSFVPLSFHCWCVVSSVPIACVKSHHSKYMWIDCGLVGNSLLLSRLPERANTVSNNVTAICKTSIITYLTCRHCITCYIG